MLLLLLLALAGEAVLRAFPALSPERRARGRLQRLQPTGTPVTDRIKRQQQAVLDTFAPDPYLGALVVSSLRKAVRTPDFTYTRETDSLGFSNGDHWPADAGIVVLGSSLVMGAGVGRTGQFSTLLERDHVLGPVLNLGAPGAGPELERRVFSRYAEPFRPRLVVLAIWLASDIDNARMFHLWLTEKPAEGFPEFRFNYGRTHPEADQPGSEGGLLYRSALLRAIDLTAKAFLASPMREIVQLAGGDTLFLSVRAQHTLAKGFDRRDTPNLREVFFGPLEDLLGKVREWNGQFLVVLLPSKEEVYGVGEFRQVLRAVEEARLEFAQRGIPVLDLYPRFPLQATHDPGFFPTDVHFSAAGNRVIAEAIKGWVKGQPGLEPR